MAGITLAQAETKLAEALAAVTRAFEAQEYAIASADGSRGATQADLDKLQNAVTFWDNTVKRLSKSPNSGSVRHFVIGGV